MDILLSGCADLCSHDVASSGGVGMGKGQGSAPMSMPGSRAEAPTNFLSPDVTWMGRGSATALGEGMRAILGAQPGTVLLAVDAAIESRNMLDGVLASLGDAGYTALVLTDFGPELRDDQVDAAARKARQVGVGAIVGIGGGTVLDAAKMIA